MYATPLATAAFTSAGVQSLGPARADVAAGNTTVTSVNTTSATMRLLKGSIIETFLTRSVRPPRVAAVADSSGRVRPPCSGSSTHLAGAITLGLRLESGASKDVEPGCGPGGGDDGHQSTGERLDSD